jgi:hypothetical protein
MRMTVLAVSTFVWIVIVVPLVIVWVLGIFDIFRSHRSRSTTAAWLLIVILLPVIGSIAYWALRKPTEKEIMRARQAAAEQPERTWQTGAGR